MAFKDEPASSWQRRGQAAGRTSAKWRPRPGGSRPCRGLEGSTACAPGPPGRRTRTRSCRPSSEPRRRATRQAQGVAEGSKHLITSRRDIGRPDIQTAARRRPRGVMGLCGHGAIGAQDGLYSAARTAGSRHQGPDGGRTLLCNLRSRGRP